MDVTLPADLENRVQAAVQEGRFASVDAAMAEAARLLVRELGRERAVQPNSSNAAIPDTFLGSMREAADEFGEIIEETYRQRHSDPVLGSMRDDAGLMDEIVADAYRHRREEACRDVDL
jgi:Arc/MetJ-type ribon-helix-helix transcriptional regulator